MNATANSSTDAFSVSSPSRLGASCRSSSNGNQLQNSAYAAICDATSVHRSGCDAAAPAPSSWRTPSFLSSFLPSRAATNDGDSFSSSFELVEPDDRYASKKHAIQGTLAGESLIETYNVYRPTNTNTNQIPIANDGSDFNRLVLVAKVHFGSHLNGHGGVVHGGILGLMFDDVMGWGCDEVLPDSKIPVTANLSIDFRRPVLEGTKVKIEVVLERWEGRKLFWKARMLGAEEKNEQGEEVLYAEATSLYIVLKDKQK
jgi:acyl-coenzyme A thioesterase PaaI-like protein